jgi:hypothetical protein
MELVVAAAVLGIDAEHDVFLPELVLPLTPTFVLEVFVEHPGAATSTAAAISGVRIRSPRRLGEAMTR